MRQSINSKRKSEGNDGTENISDQTFKKLNALDLLLSNQHITKYKIIFIN